MAQAPAQANTPKEPAAAAPALTGLSLVAGARGEPPPDGPQRAVLAFRAVAPGSGQDLDPWFYAANDGVVDLAARRAWQAFHAMLDRPSRDRADLLEEIGRRILGLGDTLIARASEESGLSPVRIVAERERTVGTMLMFADVVRRGDWVEAMIDQGEASRRPVPKPDLRRMLRPLGPVAVFGAGNFPLAYGAGGGDTASALAAGCPVVVKGHPGHPGTNELVGWAIGEAVRAAGFHPGTFSMLHSGGAREKDIGQALVRHPCVRACGFTGSFAGGMALARLAQNRPDPIPFFAEMGSVNPVFVLPGAVDEEGPEIASRLAASIQNANGQMCTCPGMIFTVRGGEMEAMVRALAAAMNESQPQSMLSARTRDTYVERLNSVGAAKGVEIRGGSPQGGHRDGGEGQRGMPIRCSPVLFRTTFDIFRSEPTLHEEVFGPAAIVVVCDSERQIVEAAAAIQGSLTGTIWSATVDAALAKKVQTVLEQRVGRLIFNGVPTGVEVCAAMVHGGPYPATNMPQASAVGPTAIKRWARPVCYQHAPEAFLPPELRNANPLGILRLADGMWTREGIGG